jgi:hypothetical protein
MIRRKGTEEEPPRPETLVVGEIEMPLPTMLQSISFATSEHDERVQLADVLAGSVAHLFAVMTGTKTPDSFARDLAKAGIADLIINPVGPEGDLIAMPA